MSSQLQNKKGLTVKDLSVCCSIDRLLYDWRRVLCDYSYTYFLLFNWSRPVIGTGVSAVVGKSTKKGRTFYYWNNHFSFEPCVRNALGNVSWWLYCVCSC